MRRNWLRRGSSLRQIVEGWGMIGKWTAAPLRVSMSRVGVDTTARHVGVECANRYYDGINMQTAVHPPRLMACVSDAMLRSDRADRGDNWFSGSR
jgi:hypothetical protein